MKATIRFINGNSDTTTELSFETIEELQAHLRTLHQQDPQCWIVYSTEEEDTD
jgi:hypothetical protein